MYLIKAILCFLVDRNHCGVGMEVRDFSAVPSRAVKNTSVVTRGSASN